MRPRRFSSPGRGKGGRVPEPPPGALGLRRDPALVPLSRDHHAALIQAQAMKRAADWIPPQDRAGAEVAAARSFVAFYKTDLTPHMGDEEEVLLPRCESADPEGAERIRADHAQLHALAAELQAALEAGHELRSLLKKIGSLLDDHVRFEERAFFMGVQAMLKPEALKTLGKALLDHRAPRLAGLHCPPQRRG